MDHYAVANKRERRRTASCASNVGFAAPTVALSSMEDLSYKELRAKAKELGIKANQKRDVLIKEIQHGA